MDLGMRRNYIKEEQDMVQARFDIIHGAINGIIIGISSLLLFIVLMSV